MRKKMLVFAIWQLFFVCAVAEETNLAENWSIIKGKNFIIKSPNIHVLADTMAFEFNANPEYNVERRLGSGTDMAFIIPVTLHLGIYLAGGIYAYEEMLTSHSEYDPGRIIGFPNKAGLEFFWDIFPAKKYLCFRLGGRINAVVMPGISTVNNAYIGFYGLETAFVFYFFFMRYFGIYFDTAPSFQISPRFYRQTEIYSMSLFCVTFGICFRLKQKFLENRVNELKSAK